MDRVVDIQDLVVHKVDLEAFVLDSQELVQDKANIP
jgi:hypothetical protein